MVERMMGLMLPMTEIFRDKDIVKLAYTRTGFTSLQQRQVKMGILHTTITS